MSLFTLYHEASRPVLRQNVCDALAGNLCRCTGYRPIVEAALSACAAEPQDRFAAGKVEAAQILRQLWDDADIFLGDEKSFFASPASEGALATLLLAHPDAVIVAGATDVGLWITKALRTLKKIVWLGRVQGLDRIENLADTVTFGAAASHAQALDVLFEIDRDLGAVMRRFGAPQVRAKGTVGGNIANGSPIGDLAPAFIALGASLELRRGDERRSLSLEDFFIAYGKQDRRQGEYLRSVTVPRLKAGEVFRAHKISKRFDEDISAVMGAFRLLLDGRHIVEATVAFGGMAGTPKRAFVVETALKGCSLDQPVSWRAAQDAIAQDFTPLSDHRASASYRSRVAANLVRRTLEEVARGANDQTRIFDLQTAE